jgi:peptidoglycan-N-acetylglucosamine deacetylase
MMAAETVETEAPSELRAGCMFTQSSDDEICKALSVVRAGRPLLPNSWPNGARVAVAITFDVDHEFPVRQLNPALLSVGEYGATTAIPRLLALLARHGIPATFFVPGMVQVLHPETVPSIHSAGPHEIGLHGWVHETPSGLVDRAEEAGFIDRTIDVLTKAANGRKPIGYRAPNAALSPYTLEILAERGIEYDSTLSGRDEPYELVLNGAVADIVEVPFSWELDDYIFLHNDEMFQGRMPSPEAVLEVFKSDFDVAYAEGTIFNLTLHPHVIGRRSRSVLLDKLITYIASKEHVWFATLGDIARHARENG